MIIRVIHAIHNKLHMQITHTRWFSFTMLLTAVITITMLAVTPALARGKPETTSASFSYSLPV